MAAPTWAELVLELPAPKLATITPEAQNSVLGFVLEVLNVGALGGEDSFRLRRARMSLAAHIATVTGIGIIAGPVTAEMTSKIQRSYAVLLTGNWSGSAFGQEFDRIVRTAPGCRLPRVF